MEDRKRAEQLQADLARVNHVSTMGELTASLAYEIKRSIGAAVNKLKSVRDYSIAFSRTAGGARGGSGNGKDSWRAADIIDRIRSRTGRVLRK